MHEQIRYFRFVARFVDAVATEPLAQALRKPQAPVRLRTLEPARRPEIAPPIPQAA